MLIAHDAFDVMLCLVNKKIRMGTQNLSLGIQIYILRGNGHLRLGYDNQFVLDNQSQIRVNDTKIYKRVHVYFRKERPECREHKRQDPKLG